MGVVEIQSNIDWAVTQVPSWILPQSAGTGAASASWIFEVEENPNPTDRTAELFFNDQRVSINQAGAIKRISGEIPLANQWFFSNWFGLYFQSQQIQPWVFHFKHDMIYLVFNQDESIFFFDPMLGWLWTTETYYPYLYSVSLQEPIYFFNQPANEPLLPGDPRWFYRFGSKAWFSDTQLQEIINP